VNVFRHYVSQYLLGPKFFVMIVLHYPPEMNLSDYPNYHAIYIDDWDFVYIDSIGVSTGSEANAGGKYVLENECNGNSNFIFSAGC
jgi:hypothetical protein